MPDLPGDLPLLECPPWPTMQWLPHKQVTRLDGIIKSFDPKEFATTRAEVVSALILDCDPTDPHLLDGLRAYRAEQEAVRPRRTRSRGVPVVLRVPSPISLRLDGVVKVVARLERRFYRHEVITTLISQVGDLELLERKCRKLRMAVAEAAVLEGQLPSAVLSQERPRPGARFRAR